MDKANEQNRVVLPRLPRLLDQCKDFFRAFVRPGTIALDLTVGNGHDTVFLAGLVGEAGHVYGFDVQAQALDNAEQLLSRHGLNNVSLFLRGHEFFPEALPATCRSNVGAAMLNLGYLPGSDKQLTTQAATTLAALKHLQEWLAPGGGISIHIYAGHPGGETEGEAVTAWAGKLCWQEWEVAAYEMLNKQQNRESLLLLVKK